MQVAKLICTFQEIKDYRISLQGGFWSYHPIYLK
jgi:hypothetical protein